jgi:hypothetical protein
VEGYVYVISNKGMPDYVKVGHTTRSPEERALELSGTATPFPAVVEYSVFVENARAVELEVHRRLAKVRASKTREWFKCSRSKAIETIKASIGPAIQQEHDRVVAEEHARLEAEEVKRQAERKRQEDEAERLLEKARDITRTAIRAKYEPQLEAAAKVPHFLVFWLLGAPIMWVIVGLTNKDGFANDLFLQSCLFGALPGMVLWGFAGEKKKETKPYLALIAARDSELAAVAQRRDVSVMMANAPAPSAKNGVPHAKPKVNPRPTEPPAVVARAATTGEPRAGITGAIAASGPPSWLAAASAPRTAGQPRSSTSERGEVRSVDIKPVPISPEQKIRKEPSRGRTDDDRPSWLAAASTPILRDISPPGFDVADEDELI